MNPRSRHAIIIIITSLSTTACLQAVHFDVSSTEDTNMCVLLLLVSIDEWWRAYIYSETACMPIAPVHVYFIFFTTQIVDYFSLVQCKKFSIP